MFFEKVYIADPDEVSSDMMDSFLLCGDINWDYYFTKKDKDVESEELRNINFIEFNDHDKFEDFIKNIDYIDYSLENNRFGILYYAKD